MKKKIILTSLLVGGLVLGAVLPTAIKTNGTKTIEKDNISYHEVTPVDVAYPHYASESEEEEEVVTVDKVTLNYVNEENDCNSRAFYVWCTGVDGVEYSDANAHDIVSYAADGSKMTIVIDIKNDKRFSAFANKGSLYYIIKFKKKSDSDLNWGGQSDDVMLKYGDFNPQNRECVVWSTPAAGGGIAQFESEAQTKVDGIKLAKFTDWKTIHCTVTDKCFNCDWSLYAFDETYYRIKAKERDAHKKEYLVLRGSQETRIIKDFDIKFDYSAHINVVYCLVSKDPGKKSNLEKIAYVGFDELYSDQRFEQYYTYNQIGVNNDLGMTYNKASKSVTVKVWSPVSAKLTLLLYRNVYDQDGTMIACGGTPTDFQTPEHLGCDKYDAFHMTYTPGGVWTLVLTWKEEKDNPVGRYYAIQADNTLGTSVTMDPYATACGVNGVRAMIYDKDETNPEGWKKGKDFINSIDPISSPQYLTPYEVHVQDFTGDESWNGTEKNGTYNAFVEGGTHLKDHADISTGYDHLKDLGINAVHLNPVYDHDNDESANKLKYNWGYNPLNYNCVEGGYSSNPFDGTVRIKEYKNLVLQLSKKRADKTNDVSTRVIMDVVYNHVSSATSSCFTKLMPRYFFRYAKEGDPNVQKGWIKAGELYDGSKCHNEVRTEATMMRKYILDSLYMWATEYNIKGFRFDLMAIIDCETLKQAQKLLYRIDPSIYMYGEGWSADGCHARNAEGYVDESLGAFTWQVYNRLGINPGEQKVYLGAFNDCCRDGVRGGNNDGTEGHNFPGAGFMQKYEENSYNKAQTIIWGCNDNVTTDGTVTGLAPEQTVNYISCHDNWTYRDQLYNTAGQNYSPDMPESYPASATQLVHATLAGHAMLFFGNAPAFMLGGEELLRTKSLDYVPAWQTNKAYGMNDSIMKDGELYSCKEDIPLDALDSWEEQKDYWSVVNIVPSFEGMWGHGNSHNSYNSPIEVNSFKWDNKYQIQVDETTFANGKDVSSAFATLIALHKTLPKYNANTRGAHIETKAAEDGNNFAGIYARIDNYKMFVSCRWGGRWFPNAGVTGTTPIAFEFGNHSFGDGTIVLGENGNDGTRQAFGYSTVIYK